jgi:hypothetical protein
MPNEIHMGSIYLSRWNERFEHGMRALSRACRWEQAQPRGHPMDVRIDREGWLPTGEEQDAGNRLWPHTGKFCQERSCRRHRHLHQSIQTQLALAGFEGTQNFLNTLAFQPGESA